MPLSAKTHQGKPLYGSWRDFDHPTWRTMTMWREKGRKLKPGATPRAYVWQAKRTTHVPLYGILDTERIKRRKVKETIPLPGSALGDKFFDQTPVGWQGVHSGHALEIARDGRLYVCVHADWRERGGYRAFVYLSATPGDPHSFWERSKRPLYQRGGLLWSGTFDLSEVSFRDMYEIAMRQFSRCRRAVIDRV